MNGARVFVTVVCALVVVDSAAADLDLNVFYLEEENYSAVRLTCTEGGFTVTNVEFLKDGDLITSTSDLVTVTNMGVGEISFTFTQQLEGMFSCRRGGGGDESEKIGLAASPAMNYDGVERLRNITFPTPESSRDINLSCPIRPGALSERYSARWVSSVPGTGEFRVIPNSNKYDITVSHASSSLDQYECQVTIMHRIGQDVPEVTRRYDGPVIVIERNVLVTIENDVQNVSIVEGESANFTCKFSKGTMSDIDIDWAVDGDQYDECGTTEGDTGNGCYTTEGTQSVLLIRDTSSFSTGSHPVQCILQQNIPEDFKNDPSFEEDFNSVMSSALLIIEPAMPQLGVEYPDNSNRSSVKLTCHRGNVPQNDAEFLKNGVVLTSGSASHQITINDRGDGEILFSFTQQQEGMFSCCSRGHTSNEIGLAASPALNYDDMQVYRYITFPTRESSRLINLSCPIRPGALHKSYSVEWESETVIISKDYDISVTVTTTSSSLQYQCRVSIRHRSDQEETSTYEGPVISLKGNVLSTIENGIENGIQNVSIPNNGESVTFTCKFSKVTVSDIDIDWTVDGDQYDECGTTEGDTGNGCYTTEGTQSVLLIRDTSSFSTGSHPVQCILQQNIPEDFKNDLSFKEDFNNVTSGALLIIEAPVGPFEKSSGLSGGIMAAIIISAVVVVLGLVIVVGIMICSCQQKIGTCSSYSPSERPIELLEDTAPNEHSRDNKPTGNTSIPNTRNSPPPTTTPTQEKHAVPCDLKQLVNDFRPVALKWRPFGAQIGVPIGDLDIIEGHQSLVQECFQAVLKEWLQNGEDPVSKTTLVEALKSSAVNRMDLAKQIEHGMPTEDFTVDDLGLLTEKLSDVSSRWRQLGIQLGISMNDLDGFQERGTDVEHYLSKTLDIWLRLNKPTSVLIEALRSGTVRHGNLADQLRAIYGGR